MDIYQRSLEYHKQSKGKLCIGLKQVIKNMDDLAVAYTPGVAAVSRAIGERAENAYVYTIKANTVAIVSDGSAILGLGNLGASAAIPVMEGKAAILREFAGVDAFPLCLDTQDDETIVRTFKAIAPVFGAINLEDIAAPRCFEIERRLRKELSIPVMHDDQHGTAVVVLAGLINALKLKNMQAADAKVLISGAGAAGNAIARMLLAYGFTDIVMADRKGLISRGRPDLDGEKAEMALVTNRANIGGTLAEGIAGRDIFIGVSSAKVLTEDMVRSMASQPIIFAMANPEPEIMPDLALQAGAYIVATGRSDFPNQANNALVFPGLFRGALDHRIAQFDDGMFMRAAVALAGCVDNPAPERILPDIFDPRVVPAVSGAVSGPLAKPTEAVSIEADGELLNFIA